MSAVSAQTDTITNSVSSLLTDTVLPQSIDLKQDISHLSFQELRLLRSYPYAIHGYHFMEADINAFFSANTKWYNNLVNDIYWDAEEGKGKFAESYGFDKSKILRVERGEVQCKLITSWAIANALGMRCSELIAMVEDQLGENFSLIEE